MEFAQAEKRNSDSWDHMNTDEIKPRVWLRRKEVSEEYIQWWTLIIKLNSSKQIWERERGQGKDSILGSIEPERFLGQEQERVVQGLSMSLDSSKPD